MKRLYVLILLTVFILSGLFLSGCQRVSYEDIIRIHIRANSNSEEDQSVKYLVKEKILDYITPLSENIANKQEMYELMLENLVSFMRIADEVLENEGFSYKASVSLDKEEFPVRTYDGITFPEGVYDALIIRLGEGAGDNWWCVAFPPLCFIGAEDKGGDYFRYKSKIYEILKG